MGVDDDEQSAAFLDSIVENIPHMVFVKDAVELRFVRFNKAGEELLGIPREDLIGKNDNDFFPPDQAAFFIAKDREVLHGKKLVEISEEPIETRAHGRRWLRTKKIPILDERGECRYLLGISEDITERRLFKERLVQDEARQRSLAAASAPLGAGDPLVALAVAARVALPVAGDGCIVVLAGAASDTSVVVAHVDVGREAAWRAFFQDDAARARALIGGATRVTTMAGPGGDAAVLVAPLVARGTPRGAIAFVVDANPRPFEDEDRAFVERLAHRLAADLDNAGTYGELERTFAAQRFLVSASEQLSESLDVATVLARAARIPLPFLADWCAVDRIESDGALHRVAAAHKDPAKEALVQRFRATVSVDWSSRMAGARAARTGEPTLIPVIDETVLAAAQLAPEVLQQVAELGARSAIAVPLVARGRVIGAVTLVRDDGEPYVPRDVDTAQDFGRRVATALDNASLFQRAQAALKARDEFLSIASHELRTPLTTAQIMLESLERAAQRGEKYDAAPQKISGAVRQLHRLASLVDGLLDVSRIATGRLSLHKQRVDLAEIVTDMADLLRAESLRKGCTLTSSVVRGAHTEVDRLRIEQVLTNLVGNALKYAPGTPIELAVHEDDGHVRATVRDHGPGIPASELDRVFERFESISPDEANAGLGLGLYIARRICEAHGGALRVQNAEGGGALFTVELPRT